MKVLVGPNTQRYQEPMPEWQRAYPQVTFAYCAQAADLSVAIADADALFGWLDANAFAAAKKLAWIQSPSTGVDRFVAIPGLVESKVVLTNARGAHAPALADHTFAFILAHTRRLREYIGAQQPARWAAELRLGQLELTGATLGILGFGTVGRAIAKRAQGFDMRVLAVDLDTRNKPPYVSWLKGPDALGELVAESDYLAVTVPYTARTVNMLGARELAQCKPGAYLVVVSRGGIVNEPALVAALSEGRLSGAGLDVFQSEPLPAASPLWHMPNVLITPHSAGGSQYDRKYILEIFGENLGRFVRGQFPLRNEVDKRAGF